MKEIIKKIKYWLLPTCTVNGNKVKCEICGRKMKIGYWQFGVSTWYACPKHGRVSGKYN